MANKKRLIDANALKVKAFPDPDSGEGIVYVQDIDKAPTVDAVEVVRCKDCKNWNVHPINGKLTLGKCLKLSRVMGDTGFCSYGERRTDG